MFDEKLETSTIWNFPKRGNWSTHSSEFRGNWSPQIVRNLILRYSKPGDLILDPFLGSGTTLIESKLLGRRGIGIDINRDFVFKSFQRIVKGNGDVKKQEVILADSRHLNFIKNDVVDLALLHPPYLDTIQYSSVAGDLSILKTLDVFCSELGLVLNCVHSLLRAGGTLALMIGDTRKNKRIVPLGFRVYDLCLRSKFIPREIAIKIQHNCNSTEKWIPIARRMNFLILKHEYIFVFDKL